MKLLWKYVRDYRQALFLALFLATINQIFSLLDPQIFRHLIDGYAMKADLLGQPEFYRGVALLLLASVGVAFISRVAKNFQDYYVSIVVQRVGTKIYSDSVEHSFSLPYAIFEDQRSGEFLQKLQKARTDAEEFIRGAINIVFLSVIGILFVLSYAFVVNWLVGLVYFSIIPTLGLVTYYISRKIKTAQKTIIEQTAALAGSTTETLRNVELVKSLGLEKQEIGRLNDVNEKILQLELKKVILVRKMSFIQGTLINALRSGLLLLMLILIFKGELTLGQFFSLMFYSFAVFNPLSELGNVTKSYQEMRASMSRLEELFKTPAEKKPEHPVAIGKIDRIKFDKVFFSYQSNSEHALNGIDFEIGSGQTIAFVGPSGSGKSTIIKLLVGLYEPTAGKITINGEPYLSIDKEGLRKKMGLVSQDTQLFAGTIRENLLFANPLASDQDCEEALGAASARALIERGDKGLSTRIGEGGLKLSGGERQRLAIARALLRKPDLIIFDEATSSLDSLTEEDITLTIKNIKSTRPDLITILVAHRLSTIVHSETIFVLEKGRLIERGSATDLLNKNGLYAALWKQQIAGG